MDMYEHAWNSTVDERTAVLVRIARAEALSDMAESLEGSVTKQEKIRLATKEDVLHMDCEVIEKRLAVLREILRQVRRGCLDTAGRMMSIWKKEDRRTGVSTWGRRVTRQSMARSFETGAEFKKVRWQSMALWLHDADADFEEGDPDDN